MIKQLRKRISITLDDRILKKIDALIDGKNIRNRSHAIEVVLGKNFPSDFLTKAVILGGGQKLDVGGQKLPKLLLPVEGKTLIEHNIEVLKACGVDTIILSLGDVADDIRNKLEDGSKYGVKIIYFERDFGNASVLRQAKSLLDDTFLMMNGDVLIENVDFGDIYNFHKKNNGLATVFITTFRDSSLFGSIRMKGNRIVRFTEKPSQNDDENYLINAGIYLMEPEVCEIVGPEFSSLEKDIFPKLAQENKLFGYNLEGKWIHLHDENKYLEYIKDKK